MESIFTKQILEALGCLVCIFKQPFLIFKQHFMHFNIFFHSHVFLNIFLYKSFQFLNIHTKWILDNLIQLLIYFFLHIVKL